uniref:VWFA domain-containing protein n=1 Tax=Macrostomum lignano TaxID=282301 RepID=A0A1I8HV10_9PLAT
MIFSECKRHNTVSKQKLPGGVLKVTRCSVKRQDCKCVKSCKTVFLRYKCKKPVQRVLCKCSRGRCRKERYITVWRLSNVVVAVCGTLSVNHRRFDATQLGGCHTVQQENQNTIRRVNCTRRVLRAIQGRCKGGKQRYIVHYWVKIGCRCVRRVRSEFRKCACAHKAVDLFLVVDLYGKDRRGYKKRIVSFLKTVSTYFLHTSASVHITMVSYNWNVHVHKLKHLKNLPIKAFTNTRTDLCGALKEVNRRLHAKSRPGVEKIVVIITCGKHSKQHKTVALADKIKRKASVFVVGFRPIPKSGLYVKWLASKPIKMHYMELGIRRKYHFSATRLFERICKKACAKPVVKHSACHKHNCRRVYTRTTFYLDRRRKKCVRRSKSWWKLCCCIHRDSVEKKCYKNRLYRVVTSYRFKKHACHRSVRRYDISAQVHAACRPRSKLHRGPCRKDGWRKDTIVTRHVAQCRCKVGRRHQLIRCRCPKQHVVNTCVRGNHQQRCHYTYTLKPTGCTKNRRCRTSRVTCKTRKIVRGKCNRSSCKRSMGSIWYTVRNCKCKRHYKVWKETCCCKRQLQKYRYCDKRSQQHVEVHSWLEFHKRSCRRVSRKIYRPVRCPSPRTKKSKCAARQNGFYRKWVECYWKKRNCVCIKYTKSRYELCRCRRGYATKKCRSGSWVYIHHYWQKSGNKCIARSKITSRVRVTCSSKRHSVTGPCNIVKGNKKYARVVQTWKRRVGCSCKTVSNSFLKLCACQKPYKRYSCLRNNRLVVTEYRFFVSGNSCKLRKFTSYRLIRCPKARTKVSKCTGKTQAVIVVIHKPVKCKCVSKIYRRVVQCKSKCRDLLPTGICRKWAASNKIQLCDKYPYFAKRLCARTCHRCYGCPKTRLIYAKNFCLSKQRHFRRSFILAQRTSFDVCMSSCQKNSKCRAFDYDHSTRKCLLLRINRRGLLLRFPSLKLRKTRDCILFERICPTKCPFRRILKQYKCSCIKLGKQRVCYRTAAVATWKRNRSGSCQRRVHKLRVPCRKCEDRREFCKKSKCSRHLVRHLCNYTCGVCKRQPRGYHWRSRCSKSGWQKDIRVQVYYDKKLRLWRVSVRIKNLRCVRCQVGSYQLIGPCKNGQRKITKIVARFVNGRCRISSHAKTYSCKNCGLVTRKLISKCYRHGKKWIRQVVTLYTIRVKGHCIVRRSLAVFSCSPKCPRDRSTVSQCKCGKRIRCFIYYVTYPGSNVCVPKRYTSSEKCASTQ